MYIDNNDPPASSRRPYHRSALPAPPDGLSGSVVPYQPSSLVKGCGSHRVRSFLSRTHSVVRERALRTAHSARAESGAAAARTWVWNGEPKVEGAGLYFSVCLYIFVTLSFPSQPSISSKFRLILFFRWSFRVLLLQASCQSQRTGWRGDGGGCAPRTRSISRWRHFLKIAACPAAAHLRSEICCIVQCSGTARVRAISNSSAFKWSDASVCPKT